MTNERCESLCEFIDKNKFYALFLALGGAGFMYFLYESYVQPRTIKVYFCDECNKDFKSKKSLNKHKSKKHLEEE